MALASMAANKRRRREALVSRYRKDLRACFDEVPEFKDLAEKFYARKKFGTDLWKLAGLIAVQFLLFSFLASRNDDLTVLLMVMLLAGLPFVLKFHSFKFRPTSANALPALVTAYFMIVYFFTLALTAAQRAVTGSLIGDSDVTFLSTTMGPSDMLHFSVVTVSTLGYGDTYPVHWIAKTVCSCAAIAGVLYIAFSIAVVATLLYESSEFQRDLQESIDSVIADSIPSIYDKHGDELSKEFRKREFARKYFQSELLLYLTKERPFEDE